MIMNNENGMQVEVVMAYYNMCLKDLRKAIKTSEYLLAQIQTWDQYNMSRSANKYTVLSDLNSKSEISYDIW